MSRTGGTRMTEGFMDHVQRFLDALPFAHALGLSARGAGPGWVELAMPWQPDLVGDPVTGVIHGGAVSALLDTACGGAVLAHPDTALSTATLDLRIDYLRAATPGQALVARAECVRVTRSVAFVRATTCDAAGADNPVACAAGAFTVSPAA